MTVRLSFYSLFYLCLMVDMVNSSSDNAASFIPYAHSDNFTCALVDESHFISLNKPSLSLFMTSLNVQGLIAKKDRLSSFIFSLNENYKAPDIISLQETWLGVNKEPPLLPNYHPLVHSFRANAKGGGVGIYIRDNLSYDMNQDLSSGYTRI